MSQSFEEWWEQEGWNIAHHDSAKAGYRGRYPEIAELTRKGRELRSAHGNLLIEVAELREKLKVIREQTLREAAQIAQHMRHDGDYNPFATNIQDETARSIYEQILVLLPAPPEDKVTEVNNG